MTETFADFINQKHADMDLVADWFPDVKIHGLNWRDPATGAAGVNADSLVAHQFGVDLKTAADLLAYARSTGCKYERNDVGPNARALRIVWPSEVPA